MSPASALAGVEDERAYFESAWPKDTPPFDEWNLSEIVIRDARLEFVLSHRAHGENATLLMVRRGEQPAYARTDLYGLSYGVARPGQVASPDLDRLLGAWALWVDRIEGTETALPDAETVELGRSERLERETQARVEQTAERIAAQKRAARAGVYRLVQGKGGSVSGLRAERLPLYLSLLLVLSLLALLGRRHAMEEALERGKETWKTRLVAQFGLPVCLVYGAHLAASLPPETLAGLAPLPGEGLVSLVLHPLLDVFRRVGLGPAACVLALGFLLARLARDVVRSGAQGVFWNRGIATYAVAFYLFARLLTPASVADIGAWVADLALAGALFGTAWQVHKTAQTPRQILTAPLLATAIVFNPAYVVFLPAYFLHLVLKSPDRERTFRYPATWIIPLFVFVASLPVFLLPALSDPYLTLDTLLFSGWEAPHRAALDLGGVFSLMPPLFWVMAAIGLVLHEPSERPMLLFIAAGYVLTVLLSVGLAPYYPVPVLTGQALVLPAVLAAVGMDALVRRIRADASPRRAGLLLLCVVLLLVAGVL